MTGKFVIKEAVIELRTHTHATCPYCGEEQELSDIVEDGLWRCESCRNLFKYTRTGK